MAISVQLLLSLNAIMHTVSCMANGRIIEHKVENDEGESPPKSVMKKQSLFHY